MTHKILTTALALSAVAWLSACSDDDGTPTGDGGNGGGGPAASIAAVSGDGQRGAPGSTLLQPFVVEVEDADGNPTPGVAVIWSVTEGGGSLSSLSSTTGSDGQASVTLTLSAVAETHTVTASVDGLAGSPVSFNAEAVAPASLTAVQGDGQEARISQPLADSLVVVVEGDDALPLPGATVQWSVTSGTGSVSTSSGITDAAGRTATAFTLGTELGAQSARATAPDIPGSNVVFNAQASQPVVVQVDMQGIAFVDPDGDDNTTIMLGDTLEWMNLDGVQHTATSQSTPTGGLPFDSGLMANGDTFRFVPAVRGLWVYFCEVHPVQMADARLTVE